MPNPKIWLDTAKHGCQRYQEEQWCTADGRQSSKWDYNPGNTASYIYFHMFADKNGHTALNCPQCGCVNEPIYFKN